MAYEPTIATVTNPALGRYGVECDACNWVDSTTSASKSMAQADADKHNAEKHHHKDKEGHWYTR